MARAGDDLGYYYVEGYIDEDYIRYEPYIEEGYITDDYFLGEGAIEEGVVAVSSAATMNVDVGRVRQGEVVIAGAMTATFTVVASRNGEIAIASTVTMSTDAERTRSSEVVLATLINLSLQGDRLRDNTIAPVVAFTTTQTALRIKPLETALAVLFSPSITVVANRNGSTDLVTSTTLTATATRIKSLAVDPIATATTLYARPAFQLILFESALSSAFTLASQPRKPTRVPTIVVQSFEDDGQPYDSLAVDNANYKFGNGSLKNVFSRGINFVNLKYGYLGSTLVGVTKDYTVSSTDDGETWSQSSSNLSVFPTYSHYTGSSIVALSSNTAYSTTDGTSWSTQTGLPGSRGLVKAGSYWYNLSYSTSSDVWRIYRGTSLSNLAAQTTPWVTVTNNYSFSTTQLFSDNTTLFYVNYSTSTGSWNVSVNNNSIGAFYGGVNGGLVGGSKILLTSNGTTTIDPYYGVYNTSGTGSNYTTPNGELCTPAYFDGTNIILETATGKLYSGTLGSLTEVYDFEEAVSNFTSQNPIFKSGSDYIRVDNDTQGFVYKSSNLTNWTSYLNTAITDVAGYVKVDDGTKFSNDWGTIDFWEYHPGNTNPTLLQNADSSTNWLIAASNNRIVLRFVGPVFNYLFTPSNSLPQNQWNHVRVVYDGTNTAIYINGTKQTLSGDSSTDFSPTSNDNGLYIFGDQVNQATQLIDELFITTDVLSDPVNDTSFTVPTTPWTDPADGTTLLLMHFDSDIFDDAPEPFGAEMFAYINQTATANFTVDNSATLTSQFTTTIDAIELESLDATTLQSAATLTADVGVVKQADSALSTIFSQTASYGRIRQGGTSLQASFAQNAINTRTRDYDSALNVQAAFASQATRIKQFEASFSAFYTQLSAVAKIGDFLVAYDNTTAQTTTVNVVRSAVAGLASAVTQTVDADVTRDANATINAVTTLTATGLRIHPGEFSASSTLTQTADVNAVRGGSASFAVNVDLNTDASGGFVGLVLTGLLSNAGITATGVRIHPGAVALDVATTQTASGDKVVGFESVQTAQTTLNATPTRIKEFSASFEAFNSQISAAARTAAGVADLDTQFAMSIDAVVLAENETLLTSNTQMSVSGDRLRETGVNNLTSATTQTVSAIKAVEAGATLLSAGGFALSALVTASGAVEFEAVFTPVDWSVNVRRQGAATIGASSSLSADVNISAGGGAQLETTAQQAANVGIVADASATIDAAMAFVVSIKVLHVQQYVYTIPLETRTFTLNSESRSHTINRETRTYTIEGE